MIVRRYDASAASEWDALVARSHNGTFLHSRRFLGYHGDRFVDRSLLLYDERERLAGVFPAALDPRDATRVTSHPGATYGGVVHDGLLAGEAMIAAIEAIRAEYHAQGLGELVYKAVPHVYHRVPAHDDAYALWRLGAQRARCDLSAAIDVAKPAPYARSRHGNIRRARREGVVLSQGLEHLPAFWALLEDRLGDRHAVRPVHTLAEIQDLAARLPDAFALWLAHLGDELVAGALLFRTGPVEHAKYLVASETGFRVHVVELLVDAILADCRERGVRWFDYGISNEDEGRVLNAGLYRFKLDFGAGGVVHEFYRLSTQAAALEAAA